MKKLPILVSLIAFVFLTCTSAVTFAQETPAAEVAAPEAVEPEAPISETAPTVEAAPAAPEAVEQPVVEPAADPVSMPVEAAAPVAEPAPAKFVVFIPERVDTMWYWYYYTDIRQYFVQGAVEKALLRAGKEIVDLTTCDAFSDGGAITQVTNPAEAIKKAASLGATYAVIGQADAVKSSQNVAYGVIVIRANANATARILRVKDGKMLEMVDATAQAGGQSVEGATQEALKSVGQAIAAKIAAAAARVEATP
jgi:hypothetical protein